MPYEAYCRFLTVWAKNPNVTRAEQPGPRPSQVDASTLAYAGSPKVLRSILILSDLRRSPPVSPTPASGTGPPGNAPWGVARAPKPVAFGYAPGVSAGSDPQMGVGPWQAATPINLQKVPVRPLWSPWETAAPAGPERSQSDTNTPTGARPGHGAGCPGRGASRTGSPQAPWSHLWITCWVTSCRGIRPGGCGNWSRRDQPVAVLWGFRRPGPVPGRAPQAAASARRWLLLKVSRSTLAFGSSPRARIWSFIQPGSTPRE